MASLEEIEKAKGRGIDWLLAQRNPDGSFGPRQEGMFYYRLPWTLAVAGRNREASMLCQWIRTNMFTEKGDFDGKFGRDLYKENYYTYPNANIIYGAHILRQFDLSVRGMQFLLTLQDKKSGGFFDGMTDKGPGGEQNIWATAQVGITCLVTGDLEAARGVASYLEMMYEAQPDVGKKLYLAYSADEGLIRNFPEESAAAYLIDVSKPMQLYFMPGIASAFLCRLYMATGEERYLELAVKYTEFAMRCEHLYSAPQVCKVGWGSALLYQVTREHRFYALTQTVADYFIEHQFPEGYWTNIPPYTALEHIIEVTAEFVVHLDTILCALTT